MLTDSGNLNKTGQEWLISVPWCLGPHLENSDTWGWLEAADWNNLEASSLTCLMPETTGITWRLSSAGTVKVQAHDCSCGLSFSQHGSPVVRGSILRELLDSDCSKKTRMKLLGLLWSSLRSHTTSLLLYSIDWNSHKGVSENFWTFFKTVTILYNCNSNNTGAKCFGWKASDRDHKRKSR